MDISLLFFKVKCVYRFLITHTFYKLLLKSIKNKTVIFKPSLMIGLHKVEIGSHVSIKYGLRLEVVGDKRDSVIFIGDNVNIEQNVHIIANNRIVIEENVSIAGHCSIVDVVHPYENINSKTKIGSRIDTRSYSVRIGKDSFIGFGVHISPGVDIGVNCIVGANSVVTKDIPDYCVAAGIPAKIIKRYDFDRAEWIKVN